MPLDLLNSALSADPADGWTNPRGSIAFDHRGYLRAIIITSANCSGATDAAAGDLKGESASWLGATSGLQPLLEITKSA